MQQVVKKRYTVIFSISFILLLFVGCTSKNEYSNSIKYYDVNVTKDKLLHAAKRVFYLAGKETFIIDSYRNDLNVTKSKAAYKLYTMDIQNEHFNFNVDNNSTNNELKASVSIYRTYGIDEEDTNYIEENSKVYSLFWDRLEYFLGYKKKWNSCAFYDIEGFLCDPIDLEDIEGTDNDVLDMNTSHEIDNFNKMMKMKNKKVLENKKNNFNELEKKKSTILKNIPSSGSSQTQEKYGILYDNVQVFDSYKIEDYQKVDDNNTLRNTTNFIKIKSEKSNTEK